MKLGLLLSFILGASAIPAAVGGGSGINPGRPAVKPHRPSRLGTSLSVCDDMKKLADGIDHNIDLQSQALNNLASVKAAVDAGSSADFTAAKTVLLSTMSDEIKVREQNQKIPGAPASVVQGLQTVAQRQAQELSLIQGLGGTSTDQATIDTLTTLFNNGIALNHQNAREALQSCSS